MYNYELFSIVEPKIEDDNATIEEKVLILTHFMEEEIDITRSFKIYFLDESWGKKRMRRWGGHFVMYFSEGKMYYNSLYLRAWNWDVEKSKIQANYAFDYFMRQWANNGALSIKIIYMD